MANETADNLESAPRPEQKLECAVVYRSTMSRFERWSLLISMISLAISVFGFGAILYGFKVTNESLRTSIYTEMSNWTFELDKTFLSHPELRPYFYSGKAIDEQKDAGLYSLAISVAELESDTMDSILELGEHFPAGAPNQGWQFWMEDTFNRSPIICKYLEDNRGQYVRLYPVYEHWRKTHMPGQGSRLAQ